MSINNKEREFPKSQLQIGLLVLYLLICGHCQVKIAFMGELCNDIGNNILNLGSKHITENTLLIVDPSDIWNQNTAQHTGHARAECG